MKSLNVRRAFFTAVLLIALLAQAWVGPVARIEARACCCKPGDVSHASLLKARCCNESTRARPIFKIEAKIDQHDDAPLLLSLSLTTVGSIGEATLAPAPIPPERPLHFRIGRGLPHRLQV